MKAQLQNLIVERIQREWLSSGITVQLGTKYSSARHTDAAPGVHLFAPTPPEVAAAILEAKQLNLDTIYIYPGV